VLRTLISMIVKFDLHYPVIHAHKEDEQVEEYERKCCSLKVMRDHKEDFLHSLTRNNDNDDVNADRVSHEEPYEVLGPKLVELVKYKELKRWTKQQVGNHG
jgi:hypothetical protein